MKEKLTKKDITQDVKTSVKTYLITRAHAETMRDAVDKVEREILKECPLTNGLDIKHGRPIMAIVNPKDTYRCTDEDMLQDYYEETGKRLREAGLKPAAMEKDYCPALVAEDIQRTTERLILDSAAEMMGMEFDGKELNHRLLCAGLEKHQKFIDLIVGLVINLPDFKNPIQ